MRVNFLSSERARTKVITRTIHPLMSCKKFLLRIFRLDQFCIANPLYFESARLKVNFLNLYAPENRARPLLQPRRYGGHGEKQKQKQVFGFSPGPKCRRAY
jgi:hypothetical protein